jgi:hypothetical protein
MKTVKPFAGVLAPVLTPFRQDLVPDPEPLGHALPLVARARHHWASGLWHHQ